MYAQIEQTQEAARPPYYTKRLPEQQQDHTTAGRRKSRRPHTHMRETRLITMIIFKTTRADFSLVAAGLAVLF